MKKSYKLTIILPVYNPHNGWETEIVHSLSKLKEEFSDIEYCVTIVNDGSTSDIDNFIEKKILTSYENLNYYSYPENKGKGFAVRYGLVHSFSDYYLYTDFDFPYGFYSLRLTYNMLVEGSSSLVIGTRGISYLKALPFERRILSLGIMFFNALITTFRVKDTQAGLKGLDNKARNVFLTTKTNSFVFELEFILKCLKAGLKYSFLNIVPEPDIKFSNFNSKTLKRELINYFKITFESN